jgi:hypothetical protein
LLQAYEKQNVRRDSLGLLVATQVRFEKPAEQAEGYDGDDKHAADCANQKRALKIRTMISTAEAGTRGPS